MWFVISQELFHLPMFRTIEWLTSPLSYGCVFRASSVVWAQTWDWMNSLGGMTAFVLCPSVFRKKRLRDIEKCTQFLRELAVMPAV